MLGDHPPECAGVRSADRFALVKDCRVPVEKRRIDNVRMAHYPAHVRGCPEDLARLDAVNIFHAPHERNQMPAIIAHDSFGHTRGAGSVEDVKRISCSNWNTIDWLRLCHQFRPIEIATSDHRRFLLRALEDDAPFGLH